MAKCNGCGNEAATRVRSFFFEGKLVDICDVCSEVKAKAVPDVWYGYGSGTHTEENIAYPKGHPSEGQPIPFSDKRSKAEAMRIAGVREAGDKKHGMRNESHIHFKKKTYFI